MGVQYKVLLYVLYRNQRNVYYKEIIFYCYYIGRNLNLLIMSIDINVIKWNCYKKIVGQKIGIVILESIKLVFGKIEDVYIL